MSKQIDYMNAIRMNTSAEYQSRIPTATKENLASIINTVLSVEELRNEFINSLVNKIAVTKIISKIYENPLSAFKSEALTMGKGIEEIASDILSGSVYDPNDVAVFVQNKPDAKVCMHYEDCKLKYMVTIGVDQLKSAFLSEDGLQTFVQGIINQLVNAKNFDEYLILKELLKNGKYFEVNLPELDGSEDKTLSLIRAIKDYTAKLKFYSRLYNEAGIMTFTRLEDMRLVIRQDVKLDIDMEVLAKLFNKDLQTFEAETIIVDDFNDDDYTYALLVDKNLIVDHDTLSTTRDLENPSTLSRNYWLHIWSIKSRSNFANAVRFRKEIPTTAITPDTESLTLLNGATHQIELSFTPANASYTEVSYASSDKTKVTVSESGLIKRIASGEVEITVTLDNDNEITTSITVE